MSLSHNAQIIYNYLVNVVVAMRQVITYGAVSQATNVPLGPYGQNPVTTALYEIFQKCDENGLPPITSIVVQQDGQYDATGRHGMPGGGYLVAEAESPNRANRRRDPGYADWQDSPRPSDTETWRMQAMIEAHQDSVWDYEGTWPPTL
jgi:hypothetical protein